MTAAPARTSPPRRRSPMPRRRGRSSRCGRSGGRRPAVEPALELAAVGPATGARVVAFLHRIGAGPATDRRVPLVAQRVNRETTVGDVAVDLVVGPRRDG